MGKLSQRLSILKSLRGGGRITPLEAFRRWGVLRLSGRILELRRQGHGIETEMRLVRGGKRVAEYRLVGP